MKEYYIFSPNYQIHQLSKKRLYFKVNKTVEAQLEINLLNTAPGSNDQSFVIGSSLFSFRISTGMAAQ